MSNQWLRLWHDMPNDPKWRTIARISGQPISLVLSVYLQLMVDASRNVTRGHADVTVEDMASALDVTDEQVEQIYSAMQGRVMDGNKLTGWEKRQPKREDSGGIESGAKSAAERKREQREREKEAQAEKEKQQCHEVSRNVTLDKDKDTDTESSKKPKQQRGSRLTAEWAPADEDIAFCKTERPDLDPAKTADRFRDYWIAQPGAKGIKTDWTATWRNWVRNESRSANQPPKKNQFAGIV
jgi:hypothetical protein